MSAQLCVLASLLAHSISLVLTTRFVIKLQMMSGEKTNKIDDLRSLFGATAQYVDVTKAELSDEADTISEGEFKTKKFNLAKAKTLVDTFDVGKLNKATFMIRSRPSCLQVEKKIQHQLTHCQSTMDADKTFNTIAAQASIFELKCIPSSKTAFQAPSLHLPNHNDTMRC